MLEEGEDCGMPRFFANEEVDDETDDEGEQVPTGKEDAVLIIRLGGEEARGDEDVAENSVE